VEELLSLQPQRQDLALLMARLPADVKSGGQTSEAAVWNRFGGKPRPPLLQSPFDSTQAFSAQEAWAKYLGLGVEVTNRLGMKFRVIPPGTFVMGSLAEKSEGILFWKTLILDGEQGRGNDETQHTVTISQPKLFGVYPVTQGEWVHVLGRNLARFKSVSGEMTGRFPVEQVNWEDAQEFLATLNAKYSLPGWRYRLPTEAEWEYACRAGTVTPFSFGSELNGRQANCDGCHPYPISATKGPYLKRPSVVGSYGANPFGLYDLHGNVWEWCGDWYGPYDVSSSQDPSGPASGSSRVLRGGSWRNSADFCRSADRLNLGPSFRGHYIGLRVMSELV
jgi:formylglycine-generating enzyme required for sulfatase activity